MKKKVLSLLMAVVMTFSLAVTANAAEETAQDLDGDIVILHTNDVHGAISGYAKVAALKDAYEARGAYVLLMDAGDFIQGDPTVSVSEGATAVELMNLAGYDVATLGNHEFDYGYENLKTIWRRRPTSPLWLPMSCTTVRWPLRTTWSSPPPTAPRSAFSAWTPLRLQPRPTPPRSRA